MLEDEQYSSDSSDDDYVPTGVESDVEELSDEVDESSESNDDDTKKGPKKTKQKKKTNRKSAKITSKVSQNEDQASDDQKANGSCAEVDKKQLDSLWANFKDDEQNIPSKSSDVEIQTTSKVYEFAGEQVKISEVKAVPAPSSQTGTVKRPPPLRSGGLSGLTSQLSGKKPKLSTLEKSKLDWDRFKNDEGIAEDLKSFNQGKQGFLERQAFLERADVKQFEIEKSFRAGRKTK